MSEWTVLTERIRQFTEMVDRMEASLAYVERLIAWSERERLDVAERAGATRPAALHCTLVAPGSTQSPPWHPRVT